MNNSITTLTTHSTAPFTITKKKLSVWILMFFFSTRIFLSSEVISALMFIYLVLWLIFSSFRVDKGLSYLIMPMALFIFIGLIGSVGNAPYNIAKDVWYVGKSVLTIMVGYILMKEIKDIKYLIKIIVIISALASVIHIIHFIQDPSLIEESIMIIREETKRGYFITVLSIVIITASRRYISEFYFHNRWFMRLSFVLCLISLTLTFSRTFWFSLIIMILIIFDYLNMNNIKKTLVIMFIAVLFVGVSFLSPDLEKNSGDLSFYDKLTHSIQEIIVKEYKTKKELALNWRGYESYCALQTYLEGNGMQYLIGGGFGKLVDIGFYIDWGQEEMRFLPILHNGYLYALVKTGLIGLLIYILYFIRFIKFGRAHMASNNLDLRFASKFIIAISITLLIATIGIAGFFNKDNLLTTIMTLGSLLSYVRMKSMSQSREFLLRTSEKPA